MTTFKRLRNGDDEPEPGKIYRLTGTSSEPSVMRGDPLEDCEVKPEPVVEKDQFSREFPGLGLEEAQEPEHTPEDGWTHTPEDGWKYTAPKKAPEPAYTPSADWGQCRDCGVPGICDGRGMGLSCGCGFE